MGTPIVNATVSNLGQPITAFQVVLANGVGNIAGLTQHTDNASVQMSYRGALVNAGILSYTFNAGTLTITSSSGTDGSTVGVLMIG